MNRHPVNVIASTARPGWCADARMALAQARLLAGMPATVAYAHDFGRESDDTNTSGEGPG